MMHDFSTSPILGSEKLFTIKAAAAELNVRYWQLQRAVKHGDIPHFTPFNSRKLVRLSDILAFIEAAKKGAAR